MKATLKENMSRSLITIGRNAKCAEAYKLMTEEWIRHLPVLDETGQYVVGMLSDRDLLRSPHPTTPVYELMSSPVQSFDIDTPIRTVVQAMIDDKLSAFMITNKGDIAGIITSEDLLLLLSQLLKEDLNPKWVLSEFLVNPVLQRTVDMASQAGI